MSQRAILIGVKRGGEFLERFGKLTGLHHLLSAQEGSAQADIGRVLQYVIIGINDNPTRAPKRLHRERGIRAGNVNGPFFGFSVGVDAQSHRHAE